MTSHELARLLLQNPDVPVTSCIPHEGFWTEVLGVTYEDGEATLEIEEDLPRCTYPDWTRKAG